MKTIQELKYLKKVGTGVYEDSPISSAIRAIHFVDGLGVESRALVVREENDIEEETFLMFMIIQNMTEDGWSTQNSPYTFFDGIERTPDSKGRYIFKATSKTYVNVSDGTDASKSEALEEVDDLTKPIYGEGDVVVSYHKKIQPKAGYSNSFHFYFGLLGSGHHQIHEGTMVRKLNLQQP